MIGTEILLIPDTGEKFLRSIKTAVMFSERVVCLSAIAPWLVRQIVGKGNEAGEVGEQAQQFLQASAEHEADFALLRREGILPPIDDPPDDEISDFAVESVLMQMVFTSIVREKVIRNLVRSNKLPAKALELCGRNYAMRTCPPSVWQILQQKWASGYQKSMKAQDVLKPEVLDRLMFDFYLKFLVDIADHTGVAIMSYSQSFDESIRQVRYYPSMIVENPSSAEMKAMAEQIRLQWAGAHLAQTLLNRSLPRVYDLPMEEVLELRRRHADQIAAFRVGLGEVTAQIDEASGSEQDRAQINRLIMTHVDPALADLKAAIKNSRLDALKRLGQSWETLAAATSGAVITYAMTGGTQNALTGIAALLVPTISAVISGHLEKRKLMNASRWSLLVSIDEAQKN